MPLDPEEHAKIIEGYAVLTRALGTIGSGQTDHDLARVIVDGELKIRALLKFTLEQLARRS